MRKISWLLLCFIVYSLLLTLPAVCYAKTSTILASTWHGGEQFPYLELEAITRITQYIYDCSVASGYTSYNWFGSETTEDHIYDAAAGVGHTYSISFFIGHGGTEHVWRPNPERQLWIYDSDGNRVYDREIYSHSECKNVRFEFLWSCEQGKTIGGTHYWSGIHYGMPFGWLHTNDLSKDGYASPDNNGYCFIGIDGDSPSILEEFDGRYAAFYYFIGHFYSAALCGDKTINEALDYASQEVWQVNFDESILYNGFEWETPDGAKSGKMVVFGDGNLNVGQSVTAPTLPAPPTFGGSGGVVCPTLFVWDGSQYVEEALLDIHADSDITLQHTIEEALVPDKNSYKLSLRELDNFTSHIDQVKLYAVDSDGEMHETHLTNATHSELGNVNQPLLHDDETRVDMTPEQTIDLMFTVPNIDDDVAYFIFEINGYNMKIPTDGPI